MKSGLMRMPLLLAAFAVLPVTAAAAPKTDAKAGAKGTPACGAKVLPLAVGHQWTYNSIVAPLPPPDAVKRLSPAQPKAIAITVKAVDAKAGETVVTLEEKVTIDRTQDPKKP